MIRREFCLAGLAAVTYLTAFTAAEIFNGEQPLDQLGIFSGEKRYGDH